MQIHIFTLFPEYFNSVLDISILGRAQGGGGGGENESAKKLEFKIINIRDYAEDKHKRADDRPFGGGAGMVMKVEPIDKALKNFNFEKGRAGEKIILTSAKGELFSQEIAKNWSQNFKRLAIICGHYEGVDERVAENLIDGEVRIGNYVLTGGEPAAAVMIDAVARLLPGVLGNEESSVGESHEKPNQMGVTQYTRPEEYSGWKVPEVLLSGDHKKIEEWREKSRNKKS